MKKNKFLKYARILCASFAMVASFTAISCSDISSEENENKAEQVQAPVLKIKFADTARTISPTIPLDELTNFKLTGKKEEESPIELTPINGYANATALEEAKIELPADSSNHTWVFTLTAKKGTETYTAETTTTILPGENPVNFNLKVTELGNGTGTFSVSFNWSKDTVYGDKVTKVIGTLEVLDSSYPAMPFFENSITNKKTTIAGEIKAGFYRLIVEFYSNKVSVAYWQEIVKVATGLSSSASREITDLSNVYQITYVLNADDTADNPCLLSVTPELDIFPKDSEGVKEVPTWSGYTFVGWYTDSSLTEPFVIADLSDDITLYAKWIDASDPNLATRATLAQKIAAANSTDASNPTTIKVLGAFDSEDFETAKDALQARNSDDVYIALDFSEATEITLLPSCAFQYCSKLVNVKLPDSLKKIYEGAFNECTNLKTITIPKNVDYITHGGDTPFYRLPNLTAFNVDEENEYFTSIDGVLYDKDVTTLIAYPSGKTDKSYTTPDTVKTIAYMAFNNKEDEDFKIVIGSNVEELYRYAFSALYIDSITFADTENLVWYYNYFNYEDALQYDCLCYNIQGEADTWAEGSSFAVNYRKAPGATFASIVTDADKITAYDTISHDLKDDFTVIDQFEDDENYQKIYWYCFASVPGKTYQLYSCTGWSSNYYKDDAQSLDDRAIACRQLDIYDSTGKFIDRITSEELVEFKATTAKTYIHVSRNGYSSPSYFRVVEPKVNLTPKITVDSGELKDFVSKTVDENDGYIHYYNSWGGNWWCWYVDGKEQSSDWGYNFYYSNFSKGPHTLTLEAEIGGRIYSYTDQVIVE